MVSVHGAHLRKQATEDLRRQAAEVAPSELATIDAFRAWSMTLAEEKRVLRAEAKARRDGAHERLANSAGALIRDRFFRDLAPAPGAPVSGYWPFGSELDIRPLLTRLDQLGYVCALPRVVARDAPLVFGLWRPGDSLQRGPLGEPAPEATAATVHPEVLLVPLLVFDRRGYRLGYGGGFYDRTLRALRVERQIVAVGVGYAEQEVAEVPSGKDDEPVDWILTERETIEVRAPVRTS